MAKDTTNMEIKISAPNIREAKFLIRGTAPLVVHKFSAKKAKAMIRQKQEAGSLANKGKSKSAKDFEEVFQGARHISTEGWDGIPAAAFRAGIISACRLVGFKMTRTDSMKPRALRWCGFSRRRNRKETNPWFGWQRESAIFPSARCGGSGARNCGSSTTPISSPPKLRRMRLGNIRTGHGTRRGVRREVLTEGCP